METIDVIIDVLKNANKPLRSSEIAEMAKVEKSLVDKTIKKLVKDEKVYSPVRCCYAIRKNGE